ncbi:hypothetical protein [Roseibacillus ishigakijimensis]|uniref:Cohesin domain-containing protein n=1 Tax=Roseibacillus ishigakijimensis TaxID=454146 RepID=A0A934RLT9_9BACT|nr:hypothetical protein [Roseibacillus ishigakijimensis]MBK1833198.1 hypothetical protein [Roseibacillus ishigakijimensis]
MISPLLLAGTQLSLGPSSGTSGETLAIPILLDSDNRLGGLQIEISFDSSLAEIGIPQEEESIHRFRAVGAAISDTHYRLLILGEEGDLLPNGRLLTLPVTLKADVPKGSRALAMSGVIVSDDYGLEKSFRVAPYIELSLPNTGEPVDPGNPLAIGALADFAADGITHVDILANGQIIGSLGSSEEDVTWAPLEPGPALVRAVATTSTGEIINSSKVEVTVAGDPLANYPAWVAYHFPTLSEETPSLQPEGDHDGDGRSNLWEYAEGTNPKVWDQAPLPSTPFFLQEGNQKYFAVRMRRRIEVEDLNVRALSTTDLSQPGEESAVTDLEEAGSFEVVTFHAVNSVSNEPKGFMRIEISQPESPTP